MMLRVRLRALALTVAGIAGLALAIGATGQAAQAAPSPGDVEAMIDQQWNQLEPIIEQYNAVHNQLKENQAKQAALQRQLMPPAGRSTTLICGCSAHRASGQASTKTTWCRWATS